MPLLQQAGAGKEGVRQAASCAASCAIMRCWGPGNRLADKARDAEAQAEAETGTKAGAEAETGQRQGQRQRQWQRLRQGHRQGKRQEHVQSRRLKDLPAKPPSADQPQLLGLRALRVTPRNPNPNPNPKPNTELHLWPLATHKECRRVQAAGCPSCGMSPSTAQRSAAQQGKHVQ